MGTTISEKIFGKFGKKAEAEKMMTEDTYEKLYQKHAESEPFETSIGAGDFEIAGKMERAILLSEGLKPDSTLLDFGCGVGRLALQVIPELSRGKYIGTDISITMLNNANKLVSQTLNNENCRIEWIHQKSYSFNVPERSVDMICAFSVFTHMEHEDAYNYLISSKNIVKNGGKFIFSCLPIDLGYSKHIFVNEARLGFETRWSKVRNVVTSIELMENIARMAGWEIVKWLPGDTPNVYIDENVEPYSFGQSVCVLQNEQ